jgi:hypothetical protein
VSSDLLCDSWVTFNPSSSVSFITIPGQYLGDDGRPHPRFSVRMKVEANIGDPTVCFYFHAFDMDNSKDLDPFLSVELPFEMLERMTELFSRVVPKTEMVGESDLA